MSGPDPMPPILYWSRSLAVHQINIDGAMAPLPGIVDMTAATLPMAMNEGDWSVIGALPADGIWLAGGERARTEWAIRWPMKDADSAPVIELHISRERAEAGIASSRGDTPELISRIVTRSPWQVVS